MFTPDCGAPVSDPRFGIRGLVIDPYNELDHQRPGAMSETEYVSQMLTKIKRFAQHHDVHVWFVAHPRQMRDWKVRCAVLHSFKPGTDLVGLGRSVVSACCIRLPIEVVWPFGHRVTHQTSMISLDQRTSSTNAIMASLCIATMTPPKGLSPRWEAHLLHAARAPVPHFSHNCLLLQCLAYSGCILPRQVNILVRKVRNKAAGCIGE